MQQNNHRNHRHLGKKTTFLKFQKYIKFPKNSFITTKTPLNDFFWPKKLTKIFLKIFN